MWRHRRPASIELPVKVGELAAGVLQKKAPTQGEERGGEIQEEDRDRDQDLRKVVLGEEEAVRGEEAKLACQKEKHPQGDNRGCKNGIRDHRGPPGSAWAGQLSC